MKILKFGGSSLANGQGIEKSLDIIENAAKEKIAVVVSARGNSTDELLEMLEKAATGEPVDNELWQFFNYQMNGVSNLTFEDEWNTLHDLLDAISLTGEYSEKLKDRVLAFGELIGAKTIVHLLNQKGIKSTFVDSRELIKTDINGGFRVLHEASEKLVTEFLKNLPAGTTPVITGFIASDLKGNTTTLGRNGSNYTATLLANYTNAEEVQNWTNIDGIYTANPTFVDDARKIELLTYREANELANFGANILHAKTILPLIEKQIPIKILNTFKPELTGTTINGEGAGKGIKAVSIINDVSLVSIEGRGLLGKVGIDARIFTALSRNEISVRMISQASSERGIGFIVNKSDAELAKSILEFEFAAEIKSNDISGVEVNSDLAIIAIIGRHNFALEKAIAGLRKNRIWMHLINNSINGEHISLVVSNHDLKKAVNVVHNQVFGAVKTMNIVAFGKGTVGGTFIDQVVGTRQEIIRERNLRLSVVGVVDSKHFLFKPKGVEKNWRKQLAGSKLKSNIETVLQTIKNSSLENLVFVDNTASKDLVNFYPEFVKNGFDLIASNKVANSLPYDFYKSLRQELTKRGRTFLYETNVGAGLPLIDTLRLLHQSGEQIKKIRGVFSGSLSYIFNSFSLGGKSFSDVMYEAKSKGLTEPDPREDLSGNDVARKLLILAREIGMQKEFEDVHVHNLIPKSLRSIEKWSDFEKKINELDEYYSQILSKLPENKVFRFVGELEKGKELKVALIEADKNTPLGNITGSDSIFEIYTEAYGDRPIVIQGAGAGAEVTARGVYADLLRVGSKL
jgi:aspartokinase/homoserine dehydrogenase 1